MIQRIQSVYLLLAAILLIVFIVINPFGILYNLDFIMIIIGGMAAMDSFAAIFLYTDRSKQIKLVYMAFAVTIALMIYSLYQFGFSSFYLEPSFFLLPLILLLQLLAIRGIKADEALVKSSYRLR